MAESRDRLVRAVDLAELFFRWREGNVEIYRDQPELEMALSSPAPPFRRVRPTRRGNMPVWMGSGCRGLRRGSNNCVLPSWYPRTPLRDVTTVVRAIERGRERLRGSEAEPRASRAANQGVVVVLDPLEQTPVAAHNGATTITTLIPTLVGLKQCPPTVRVQKILCDIANQPSADSESLTPQRKLLNSIDTVGKVVKEELLN